MQAEMISHQQVVELVMTLPSNRLMSVYDFVRFIKLQSQEPSATTGIFGETEDEIRADDKQWERQFEASHNKLRAMAREAAEEYRAGRTKPMEFTPAGRLVR